MFKKMLVDNFPFLGKYKRYIVAFMHTYFTHRSSYSQHGEDIFILNYLKQFNLELSKYIDVGANHPTDISNTLLLYRFGLCGIIFEPNIELLNLFKKFRKKDQRVGIGLSNKAGIFKFNISKTPVLSSFKSVSDIYESYLVPILTLDEAMSSFEFSFISFLNIDVEGLNIEVIEGSSITLQKTLLLCVEFDDEDERLKIIDLVKSKFKLIETFGCNLIFENTSLKMSLKDK